LIEKLFINPDRRVEFLNLYAGHHPQPLAECPSNTPYPTVSNSMNAPFDMDVSRMRAIVEYNLFSFGQPNTSTPHAGQDSSTNNPQGTLAGIYLVHSYANHSCVPNSVRMFFGDLAVLRAAKNIGKGEEICHAYISGNYPYEKRAELLKHWSINCNCRACHCDRGVGMEVLKSRTNLFSILDQNNLSIPQIRKIVQEIDNTYLAIHPSYRPVAMDAHYRLAYNLRKTINLKTNWVPVLQESIEEEMETLERAGVHVIDRKTGVYKAKDSPNLPISTRRVPYDTDSAVRGALKIAEMLELIRAGWRTERWLRAAVWCKLLFSISAPR
jgi:hypothetical protein